jgi:hypothetical protein
MAYHVMTIIVFDMQSEDIDFQCLMWSSLVRVLEKHGVMKPNFKGFMADSAQANFNTVCRIFRVKDPTIMMLDKKRTCLLH